MTTSLSNGSATVTVAEIIAAPLVRRLRREAVEALNDDDYRINSGTPGKLSGTITYLCNTLVDALALDTLYQGTAAVTLTTGTGAALNGLKHVAVGELRYNTEKATPGHACKWTVQVEIREVP